MLAANKSPHYSPKSGHIWGGGGVLQSSGWFWRASLLTVTLWVRHIEVNYETMFVCMRV